ncbi:MAG TPA: sigma 54-interacting transcriptional regulator [Vicinamibacteria bacterium]|nr:sigma 54-interacting transcriptional regulator [Vicinamibacteria bacterium]
MKPMLVALSGPVAGRSFSLEGDRTSIGRESENDIVIDTQWVSRRHCTLERSAEGFVVLDNGSHNGTFVNGIPVTERLLRAGDRLTLGGSSLLFVDGEVAPADGIQLDDTPLDARETVQLRSDEALYLDSERLQRLPPEEDTKRALVATLGIIRLLGRADDETLPEQILDRFFQVTPAERGAILVGSSPDEIESATYRVRHHRGEPKAFPVSRSALSKVFAEKTALLSNRVSQELKGKSLVGSGISSLVCLPLVAGDRVLGAIYLDARDPAGEFQESQLELLVGLSSVAANALAMSQELGKLRAENRRLQTEFELEHDMVGESPRLKAVQKLLARAAPTDATVLVEGESGTGKELAARALHWSSPRRNGPFVKVDCTGLNENLLASELFGHERGAFTGAIQQKKGKLELAHGGTVFLDEIGELPPALQAQLLRVLQDREFERVGGTKPISIDIRLVAATNRDIEAEVKKGNFREDLFFRLNVVRVKLPPLRERRGDIGLLARFYAADFAQRVKRPLSGISPDALAILERYDWPGNIRELANTMERAVVLGATEQIVPDDLPEMLLESKTTPGAVPAGYHEAVAQKKKELILDAVSRGDGSITEAAKLLGLHPNYLHRLIRNLGLRDQLKE